MPHPISLVALDLDGTLLNSEGRLTARTREAIGRAMAAGVRVVLATGKSRASAEHLLEALDLQTPGVFTQGLVLYDAQGEVLHETILPQSILDKVVAFVEARCYPHFAYTNRELLAPADGPLRQMLHTELDEPLPRIVGPFSQLGAEDGLPLRANKLLVSDESDNAATRAALASLVGEEATVTQAVPEFIEVLPPGTSKGAGLMRLLKMLDLDPSEVMAVGDGENDVEMLRTVGLGVAMGNAHPRLKEVADAIVADNDHNGVAEAIERFVLGEPGAAG